MTADHGDCNTLITTPVHMLSDLQVPHTKGNPAALSPPDTWRGPKP